MRNVLFFDKIDHGSCKKHVHESKISQLYRAEEENELFLKASLFMFQCFLSLLISFS